MSTYENCDFEMVDHYIVLLQEFLSTGTGHQGQLNDMISHSDELLRNCPSLACESALLLVADIRELLSQHIKATVNIGKPEADVLRLACDWLIQLSTLHKEGLPEPTSLVLEVRQLLVSSVASFSEAHNDSDGGCADPFADDSFFDELPEAQVLIDPFDEDPGLSSGLERLQRTVTYVKSAVSSRRLVSDPFSGDPQATIENLPNSRTLESDQAVCAEMDIFSDDPALELD